MSFLALSILVLLARVTLFTRTQLGGSLEDLYGCEIKLLFSDKSFSEEVHGPKLFRGGIPCGLYH